MIVAREDGTVSVLDYTKAYIARMAAELDRRFNDAEACNKERVRFLQQKLKELGRVLDKELNRRFKAGEREVIQRFIDADRLTKLASESHTRVHDREREFIEAFKKETIEWRKADNQFREQLTKERGDYIMRKEILPMLAATGGVIVTIITVIYFIVFTIRGGNPIHP